MRTKLTELISTLDRYNEMDLNCREDDIEVSSNCPVIPEFISVKESERKGIEGLLIIEGNEKKEKPHRLNEMKKFKTYSQRIKGRYVKTFDRFLAEGSNFQKFPPQDPDYDSRPRGWNDNGDSDEEEE